jgi:hypothetical protein
VNRVIFDSAIIKEAMHTLHPKDWLTNENTHQKFLSVILSHQISRIISRKKFEVVNESFIDINNMDSDIADIIVYNHKQNFSPELIIEFCTQADLKSTLNSIEIISDLYHIKESFIYNTESAKWYKINDMDRDKTSFSKILNINLDEVLNEALLKYAS